MEINNTEFLKAKEIFSYSFRNRDNVRIVDSVDPSSVAELPLRSTSSLGDGEIAEFFTAEHYISYPDYIQIVETIYGDGQVSTSLFALCERYFLVNNRKIGGHLSYIDVGGLVRRHFDLTGLSPDAEGKVKGAVRAIVPYDFNLKLASFEQPWSMLTNFLAGKKVRAKRSTDKLFFQAFVNRQPVPDKYVEQTYMIYSFVIDDQKKGSQNPTRQNSTTIIKYDHGSRSLLTFNGVSLKSRTMIDDVRMREFPGRNFCDWEVVYRMARRSGQDAIPLLYNGEFDENMSVRELGKKTSLGGGPTFEEKEEKERKEKQYRMER